MAIAVLMPALSPTMTKGNLVKWHKKEGDPLTSGMILADIETDKATMEIEVVDEGVLGKILIPEGTSDVPVQAVIALIAENGEDPTQLEVPDATPHQTSASEVPIEIASQPTTTPSPAPMAAHDRVLASPLAKRTAEQRGIDLRHVRGTGPKGRIIQADVLEIKPSGVPPISSRPEGGFIDQPISAMRQVIAERLTASKREAPHFYLDAECNMDAAVKLRHDINNGSYGVKLSLNDFVVRAVALALRDVPELNVSWMGHSIRAFHDIHVAVAVSIPGGLVTPVVRNTDMLRLRDVSASIKTLATAAREGKLRPADYQGGTITVSNLGMYGVTSFGAIINPPQAAILAVGAVEKCPIVRHDVIVVSECMKCTLSVDHRAVDGADAARWLQAFRGYMEAPASLLFDLGL